MPRAQIAGDREPVPDTAQSGGFSYFDCAGVRVWKSGGIVRIQACDAQGAPVELSADEIEALIAALKR